MSSLKKTSDQLARALSRLPACKDIDSVRGIEGESSRAYFSSFDRMVREDWETFRFNSRNRRPPRDSMNALISFLYDLLMNDCVAGAEGVGLDPQMGFLHAIRLGRAALDLMEEIRSVFTDRLALTLINWKQIKAKHFIDRPGGAVH